jgi:acyl carrier protein
MMWSRASVRTELIQVFQQHAQDGVAVEEKSHLVADLGIDSLGVMEVVSEIEDKFALSISDEAFREVETVADVARAVETRLASDGKLVE